MKQNKKHKGFTLIELVVVIIIIGILAAVAAPRLMSVTDQADTTANIATAKTINSQITIASVKYNGDTTQVTADDVNGTIDNVTVTKGASTSGWAFTVATDGQVTVTLDGTEYYPEHP